MGMALLGLAAFIYLAQLTQGERLFDNDYDWIAAARVGWLEILGRIFAPIPESWGFQDRPVQVLCFKILYTTFSYSPAPYYALKALLLAGVACGIVLFCLRTGPGLRTGFAAAGVFVLSGPVFSSALWVSDFELLAQIFILAAFGLFLALEQQDFYSTNRLKFYLYQAGILIFSLLGHRTKGSAKLIPAVLLVYLVIYRRNALRRYLPLLALIALTIVPVFALLSDPVPPFAPFSEDRSQGWMWRPANLETLGMLLVGNAHLLTGVSGIEPAYSLLGVLCPVLFWAGLGGIGFILYRRRDLLPLASPERAATIFVATWLVVVMVSFSAFPRLPLGFMSRYVTGALVPTGILIALVFSKASAALPAGWKSRAIPAIALIVLAHGAVNFRYVRHARETLGQLMVAYDRARISISESIRNANVLMLDLPFSYNRPLDDGNHYIKRLGKTLNIDLSRPLYVLVQHDGNAEKIDHIRLFKKIQQALRVLPAKDVAGYRVGIRPVRAFHGLTDSLYDRWIYRSTNSALAVLYHIALDPIDPQKGIGQ